MKKETFEKIEAAGEALFTANEKSIGEVGMTIGTAVCAYGFRNNNPVAILLGGACAVWSVLPYSQGVTYPEVAMLDLVRTAGAGLVVGMTQNQDVAGALLTTALAFTGVKHFVVKRLHSKWLDDVNIDLDVGL